MTPEVATSWMDMVNTGGTIFVLIGVVVYGAKMVPAFMKRWGEHTIALTKISERLAVIERELDNLVK